MTSFTLQPLKVGWFSLKFSTIRKSILLSKLVVFAIAPGIVTILNNVVAVMSMS